MKNPLDLPPELQHLIEKRDESDRREKTRRTNAQKPVAEEKRSNGDRRKSARRNEDA